jgi:hypothetical protein
MPFPRFLSVAIALSYASCCAAQGMALSVADRAFVPLLQRSDGALRDFAIVSRRQVDGNLDIVLALGSPNGIHKAEGESFSWLQEDRLGIFLQDRADSSRVYTLAIEPGPPCSIHLERVTDREVLISCPGDYDWGKGADNQKFVFDITSKRLLEYYSYPPFANYVLVGGSSGPVFVADDPHHLLAAAWVASSKSFQFLSEAQASEIFERISIRTESAEGYERRIPAPLQKQRIAFGPEKRFELLMHSKGVGAANDYPVIVEHSLKATRQFPLPQTSRKEWMIKRADEAKHIFPISAAEIGEQIGPYQVEGDRLWFGKTFYNGEGSSGVGGFGYFDPRLRSYRLYAPREIWKWSVSVLLAEPDALWLGLIWYGEGADSSGGLLRWDRTTESVRHFDLNARLTQILRSDDALFMASGDGIEVLRGAEVERYIVDSARNGKLSVVACEGGYR